MSAYTQRGGRERFVVLFTDFKADRSKYKDLTVLVATKEW